MRTSLFGMSFLLAMTLASSWAPKCPAAVAGSACTVDSIDAGVNSTGALPSAGRDTSLMQLTVLTKVNASRTNAHDMTEASLSDAAVARHIQTLSLDASNVANVVRCGIQSILDSVTHFMASPPRVLDGISELGTDLFSCVEKLLIADANFHTFKTQWVESFESILSAAQSIEDDINQYIKTGNPPPLVRAISSILGEAGSLVSNFLPSETGMELRKYLDAISEAFETLGSSWDDFAKGRTVEGIETIYLGLKGVTDYLIPDAWKNNTIYVAITATLDTVLGNLSQHVLEYERRIMESNVCWRAEESREWVRPEICAEGWAAGGDAYCYRSVQWITDDQWSTAGEGTVCRVNANDDSPDGQGTTCTGGCGPGSCPCVENLDACKALCTAQESCMGLEFRARDGRCEIWTRQIGFAGTISGYECLRKTTPTPATAALLQQRQADARERQLGATRQRMRETEAGQLDKSMQQKGGDDRPRRGAIPARCDKTSRFSEKQGHMCLSTCGNGFEPKSGSMKCISKCEGNFSSETPAMCGRDPGIITKAIIEMVTVVMNSAFQLSENIIRMKEHGVDANSLSSTIQVFIDMGKPFANPICPEPDTSVSDP
jgi:hypothetical protein